MDDTINREIIYGEYPPKGIYFTVLVEYFSENPTFNGEFEPGTVMVTAPLASFPDALEASDIILEDMLSNYMGSQIDEVDPDTHEGFHAYLKDGSGEIMARIAIEPHDLRGVTLH